MHGVICSKVCELAFTLTWFKCLTLFNYIVVHGVTCSHRKVCELLKFIFTLTWFKCMDTRPSTQKLRLWLKNKPDMA